MPSSASSTTLERSSSLPTLTDASPPPSLGSSRSSVLECHQDGSEDHDVFITDTCAIEACQQATAHLTVAKRLLSSAKLYRSHETDALRAVRSFGDSLASLLRLRTLSPPTNDASFTTYLQQPAVLAHVSKLLLLSGDLDSCLAPSKDSIDAHANLSDSLIQGLEGLQNSVNEVLGKSLFNDGPDMHRDQENLSHDLAVPRPTRDNDDEHFVNLTAQRREGNSSSNFHQAQNQGKQQHPLIYAQAICSLLLSSLNGLEESSFNAQVFSLANDVVRKTQVIPSHANIGRRSHSSEENDNDDCEEDYDHSGITRPLLLPPVMQIAAKIGFPTIHHHSTLGTSSPAMSISSAEFPSPESEKSYDHGPHISDSCDEHTRRLNSAAPGIIERQRQSSPPQKISSSPPNRLQHPRRHSHYHHAHAHARTTQRQIRSRSQSLLTLSLAFFAPTTITKKPHDYEHSSATTTTTTATATYTAPTSPAVTIRSTRSMFSKFPARPHTLFSVSSFSSSTTAAAPPTPGKPAKYDVSRKSSPVGAEVVCVSTNGNITAALGMEGVDRQGDASAKWPAARYRTMSSPSPWLSMPLPFGGNNLNGSKGDSPAQRRGGAKAGAPAEPGPSARDLLFATQSRAGPGREREAAGVNPSTSVLSTIRTRALTFAPSLFPSDVAYDNDDNSSSPPPFTNKTNQNRTPSSSPTRTPRLMVTSPSSSPTRSFHVSQILTPSTANIHGGRLRQTTHPIPSAPGSARRRPPPSLRTQTLGGNASRLNHPNILNSPKSPSPSASNSTSNNGAMPPLHPALAAVERSSRLLKQSVRCAVCSDVGKDFPRCGKCSAAWCSRECRVKSLAGMKRHVCASTSGSGSGLGVSVPSSAAARSPSAAARDSSAAVIPTVPAVPIHVV